MVKKIGIVSLSSGILGEDFIRHEVEIGTKRLAEYGIETVFLPNALLVTYSLCGGYYESHKKFTFLTMCLGSMGMPILYLSERKKSRIQA